VPQFLIEREISGAGNMTGEQFRDASKNSNEVLAELEPEIQWVLSEPHRVLCRLWYAPCFV